MIPDLTVLWVIFFVLLCAFVLNALIFKPILHITGARESAVREAKALAGRVAREAANASADYDRTLNTARAEVYRQMDDTRRLALERRAALLEETKREVETDVSGATTRVATQAAEARARLDRDAGELAGVIVNRVLGRSA